MQGTHLAQRVACGDKPYDKPNGQDMYRFDPAAMADALCYLLRNRWFGPGRVAQTLSDCASISALSGYCVVQVIAALLPDLDGIRVQTAWSRPWWRTRETTACPCPRSCARR